MDSATISSLEARQVRELHRAALEISGDLELERVLVTPFFVMAPPYASAAFLFWIWFRPLERSIATPEPALAAEPAN